MPRACDVALPLLLGRRRRLALAAAADRRAPRSFGVYVDPWHVAGWARNVGRAPQYVARFEAFSRGATVDAFLREAERQGLAPRARLVGAVAPVPAELGVAEQFRPQPGYRNATSPPARRTPTSRGFARSLATFRGRVDLRYAHEMNGTWYPWSHDPVAYRRAWRHVVRLVPRRRRAQRALRLVARTRACTSRAGAGGAACASTGPAAATWTRSARR